MAPTLAAHSGTGAAANGVAMSVPVLGVETAPRADPATLPKVGAGDTATDSTSPADTRLARVIEQLRGESLNPLIQTTSHNAIWTKFPAV